MFGPLNFSPSTSSCSGPNQPSPMPISLLKRIPFCQLVLIKVDVFSNFDKHKYVVEKLIKLMNLMKCMVENEFGKNL